MKNQTMQAEENKEKVGKVGLTAATLPWWARVLIAQHSEAAFPSMNPHKIHHCSDCGCVLISTSIAYQYSFGHCPECSTKKRTSQGGN